MFFLLLVAVALFFVLVDQALLAGLCGMAAILAGIAFAVQGFASAGKAVGEGLTKGIPDEISNADTGYPDSTVLKEGLEGAASLAGQQLFAGAKKGKPYVGDQHQFKFKGVAGVSQACDRIIGLFKKIFN